MDEIAICLACWWRRVDLFEETCWSLLWRQCQRLAQEVQEGRLSRVFGTNDKNAKGGQSWDSICAPKDLLVWRWVLSSPHTTRTIDGANCTACIAVPTTMGHALGSCVGILSAWSRGTAWHWRHSEVLIVWCVSGEIASMSLI